MKSLLGDEEMREIINLLKTRHNELMNEMGVTADYIRETSSQGDDVLAAREGLESIEKQGEIEESELQLIEGALERIRQNKFGRCFGCGKPIVFERLKIVPYTKYCVACEEKREKG